MMFGEFKLPASSRDFHDQRGAFMREGKYESSEGNTAATAITHAKAAARTMVMAR